MENTMNNTFIYKEFSYVLAVLNFIDRDSGKTCQKIMWTVQVELFVFFSYLTIFGLVLGVSLESE